MNLQEQHEHLETELFEKNEEFTKLSTASKNLYKEYETLKNQYETETGAMARYVLMSKKLTYHYFTIMEFSVVSATKYDHIVSLFLYVSVMISFLSEFRKSTSTKLSCNKTLFTRI